jgi:hypothetical protein
METKFATLRQPRQVRYFRRSRLRRYRNRFLRRFRHVRFRLRCRWEGA